MIFSQYYNKSFLPNDDCIKSIQLMSEDGNYFTNDMNMDNISVSRFIQQNQLLSFNLVIEFN